MARPKRVLTPPLSPAHSVEAAHVTGGNFARKKFRARSEQQTSGSMSATSVDQQSRESRTDTESPGLGSRDKLEVPAAASPRPDTYHSLDTEHIAKKKRAMFQVRSSVTRHGTYVRLPSYQIQQLNYLKNFLEFSNNPIF